jgi:hypothetical protein
VGSSYWETGAITVDVTNNFIIDWGDADSNDGDIVSDSDTEEPITVATLSKAWTVFTRSNTGIVGSNPTWGMDVCVRFFCVCHVLYAGSGLATGWSTVQEVLPIV